MLAENCGGGAPVAQCKNQRCGEKVDSEVSQFDAIQNHSRPDRRENVNQISRDKRMEREEESRDAIDGENLRAHVSATLGKNHREMDEQGGLKQPGHDVAPINHPVEWIQFAAVVERIQNEGEQTENIKMYGARRIPALDENEHPDEEIEKAGDAEVVFERRRIVGVRRNQLRIKCRVPALDFIREFCPLTRAKEHLRDLRRAVDWNAAHAFDVVTGPNPALVRRRARGDMPSLHAGRRIEPGDAVIWRREDFALLEIKGGKNDGSYGQDGECHRSNPHSKPVVHRARSDTDIHKNCLHVDFHRWEIEPGNISQYDIGLEVSRRVAFRKIWLLGGTFPIPVLVLGRAQNWKLTPPRNDRYDGTRMTWPSCVWRGTYP